MNQRNGKLMQYANGSCFFIKYPLSPIDHEKVTPVEINKMFEQRISHTRKSGQNGFKMNTDHSFWLKDKHTKRRIKCEKTGSMQLLVKEESKTIPVFELCKISYKR